MAKFKPVSPQINFPEMERDLLKKWYDSGIVEKYLHRNDTSEKRFSFLDGPITANNPMGVHHAWGRTYKDLWQRFWNMRGYKERFQNGFDCQGLWVEVEVEKELGLKSKKDIENLVPGDKKASIAKFVQLCKDRVYKFSAIQTDQSKRLGYFMDWENSYYTMSDENNYMIWYFLKQCHEKGWLYKGHDSVPWCPRCETAISQHEMLTEDYKEVVHESIFIEFPIVGRKDDYLLVWTTTPWTIPANIAVAVDADLDYAHVKGATGNTYWIVKERVEEVFKKDYEVIETVKGKELVGLKYEGPFDHLEAVAKVAKENPDTFHTVVATDAQIMPISTTEGTGLVHTAVSAGVEDFKLGKKLGLPLISVIADDASYLQGFGEFSGKNAKKHPELIIEFMKSHQNGRFLFDTLRYKHRYPACWRCKAELVWKVADEWYISMDKKDDSGKTYREQMMEVAQKITWLPSWGKDREMDWLKNMHDWLISKKNRYWGLALPIFECKKCGTFEVVGGKEELQEKAVAGWEQLEGHSPHKPYIDDIQIKCSKCGEKVSRIDDVGNPWLDAGIVPFSTLHYGTDKQYWSEWFPVDFVTESFPGQFKNWFYALIAMATVLERKNPFKTLLGYASVLAEDGRAMHKSWGNSIEFNEGADKIGVDVMRWMYVTADPEQNLLFGYKKADETRRKFHLMLWNIYNFFITYANLDGWESRKENKQSGNVLDQWIISRLHQVTKDVTVCLEKYDVQQASLKIEQFVNDLSLWYVRRSRDRVGLAADNEEDKNACYQTLYTVLVTLTKLMAPFTPFFTDGMYTNLTGEESVHLTDWPEADTSLINETLEAEMAAARQIVEMAHAKRKEAKIKVRQPLASLTTVTTILLSDAVKDVIKNEVNVKEVINKKGATLEATLDTNITPELQKEGEARDIIRQIQDERKKLGTKMDEQIDVVVPSWPVEFEEEIKKKALIRTLSRGESFAVTRL